MNTQADLAAQYKSSMDPGYVQKMADQYGVSPDQLYSIYASTNNPYTNTDANYASQGVQSQPTFQTLSLLKTLGITGDGSSGQKKQQQPQWETTAGGVRTDPIWAATNLGAAALNMPAVYDPTPQEAGKVSGVGKYAPTVSSTDVPTAPAAGWQGVGQAAGLSQNDINAFKAQGLTPSQVAEKFGVQQSPVSAMPGIFGKAPTVAPTQGLVAGGSGAGGWPQMPQATAAPVGIPTAFAKAPPAPGVQVPQGIPAVAPYTGTVHDDPFMSHAVSSMLGMPNPWHNTDGTPTGITQAIGGSTPPTGGGPTIALATAPTAPAAPVKMQSGGFVPGDPNDNTDSVSAKLTPGEYVIPKQQARHLTERPESMAAPTHTESAAANETMANLAKLYGGAAQQGQGPPAAPGGYTGPTASQLSASANSSIGSGGRGSLDNLGTLGDEGLINSMGVSGGGAASGAAGVAGGLASGLSSAAQQYAASIKPWQMKQQAFSPNAPVYQPVSFREPGAY